MAVAKSAADIAAEMVAAMKVAEPELDTSIGTVVRKIFDVVAEQISPAYATSYLSEWVYDIDTKAGEALDDYVAQFGFYRIPAKRSSGLVTFSRDNAAKQNYAVPANSFVVTDSTPRLVFATVAGAWLLKGTTEVSVPVQAVEAGSSGNLPVGSITQRSSALTGINVEVEQAEATTGGADAESDESLRSRFRNTVFRSIAGTEDMFLGVALEDSTPDDDTDQQALQARVLGPTSRWVEQVQEDEISGFLASSIPQGNYQYIYDNTEFFGADIEGGSILTQGVHYDWNVQSDPPQVEPIGTNVESGTVYDLDFEYVSTASRNNPNLGITNRVDVWVSGISPVAASETTYYQPVLLVADGNAKYWAGKFLRDTPGSVEYAQANNFFLQLAWGPIVDFPESLIVDGTTYDKNVDFWVVHDVSAFGLSPRSMFGLEFRAGKQPPSNAQIVLSGTSGYFFNEIPTDVQDRVGRWGLVTDDVMVHAARPVRLVFNFAVMYQTAYDRGAVQTEMDYLLSNWVQTFGFSGVLQISDVLQQVRRASGLDNIRFLNSNERAISDDPDSWGIQIVSQDGTHIAHLDSIGVPARPIDHVFRDNEVPVLHDARYLTKAQNTFSG